MNKLKMAQFSKFKMLLALKSNFNGCQFHKVISKFGYFNKWKKVRINIERLRKLKSEKLQAEKIE